MTLSPEATYERALRLANVSMRTIALQCRRLRSEEPEDSTFILRRWADFDFLIVALTRLRRAASIAKSLPQISAQVAGAIDKFDDALPSIKQQRDIAEHIDEYAVDSVRRHDKTVDRKQLEVGTIDEESLEWLGQKIEIAAALSASEALFAAVKSAGAAFPNGA
jgi:hypothetical protein